MVDSERQLSDKKRHIEHFQSRNDSPNLTFIWSNLFGSCGKDNWDSCGIFKDTKGRPYDHNKLIKPDQDNPREYLLFLTNGLVVPRPKTSPSTSEKAATTIKVFNLNAAPKLVGARREALRSSVNTAKEIYEWREGGEIDEDTFDELIQEELESLEGREFETALRDIFEYNSFYGE
ncbi:retron system putative HNH endonuclease [Alteromonas sp. BMJM2]|uniref:retron system putative HNH endonuclease n=1 Tax=Alteromonas sp. BMJM2 TaxID=2954241 RepID=UPI0022B2D0D8|nr:retron system putative HNH endonuclease [Alteromonas sp. BMJM2]